MDSTLAIIPARGGSKRIPRKNVRNFCGKPILSYSIKAAKESELFHEVMVSTDDEEIADIARKFGAVTPYVRSRRNSNDYATTADVIKEVLNDYSNDGKEYDYVCCIYPTAPFITSDILKRSYEKLRHSDFHCILPIMKFSYPIQRSFLLESDGTLKPNWPEHMLTRSQDLPETYHDAGQFYFFRSKEFLRTGTVINDRAGGLAISESAGQDIDTETDWKLAELKYRLINDHQNNGT